MTREQELALRQAIYEQFEIFTDERFNIDQRVDACMAAFAASKQRRKSPRTHASEKRPIASIPMPRKDDLLR